MLRRLPASFLILLFTAVTAFAGAVPHGSTSNGSSDAMTLFLSGLSADEWGSPSNTTATPFYYTNDTGAIDYNSSVATGNSGSGGTSSPNNVWEVWTGGIYDSTGNRGIAWGGGHLSYCGNEFYAFNFSSLQIQRLNTPDDYSTQMGGACAVISPPNPYMPNGDAIALHTYSTPVFIPSLFTEGAYWTAQPFYGNPMYYDLSKGQPYSSLPTTLGAPGSGWNKTAALSIGGTPYAVSTPSAAVYDSSTNRVYLEEVQVGGGPPSNLLYWDVSGNTWSAVAPATGNCGMTNGGTGLQRTGHGEMWVFWQDTASIGGGCVSSNSNGMQITLSSGAASYFADSNFNIAFPGGSGVAGAFLGACYVQSIDKFFLWSGGNTLVIFNPVTKTSVTYSTTGTVPAQNDTGSPNNGAMTKFWCDTAHHAIILWYTGSQPMYVLKTSKF